MVCAALRRFHRHQQSSLELGASAGDFSFAESLDRVTLDEVRAVGTRMLAGPRAVASVGAKLALAA